jgi:hypothetical protein
VRIRINASASTRPRAMRLALQGELPGVAREEGRAHWLYKRGVQRGMTNVGCLACYFQQRAMAKDVVNTPGQTWGLGGILITDENYFLASGPKIRVVTSDGSVQDRHR